MSTKSRLLEIFNDNTTNYLSGQELANALGVSRNSVWKAIEKLREEGFLIDSKAGVGYRLLEKKDVFSEEQISEKICTPCKVHVLPTVDSTNDYAKKLVDDSLPNIIISNEQTKGRGRMGRSFYSPASKGLYITISFKPDFGIDKATLVTTVAALAICKAIEAVAGVDPKIKWVNDIYLKDKKICGVLTEAETSVESGSISKIIVGIGINCFEQEFPDDISEKATYIENATKEFSRNDLAVAIVNNFFSLIKDFDRRQIILEYKSRSMILGQRVTLYGTSFGEMPENGGKGTKVRAVDIDDNGGLVVEYLEGIRSKEMDVITSGEVTLRKDFSQ